MSNLTGERIRNRRRELGLSVEDLAKKIGKNRATLYRYENGYIDQMPIGVIPPLAKALGVTPSYLMGWDEENNKPVHYDIIPTEYYTKEERDLIKKYRTSSPELKNAVAYILRNSGG